MQTTIVPVPAKSTSITDPAWLRFQQPDLENDTATVSETADLLDALYSLDPCSETETTTEEDVDLAEAAATTLSLAACLKEYDGSVNLALRVYRSHPNQPYTLRVSGGAVVGLAQTIQTEAALTITVEQATSHTLDIPIRGDLQASWLGTVGGGSGGQVDPPKIEHQGNTLYWQGRITGTLQIACRTEFDLVSLRVAGVDGEMGQATVRGFYQGECTVFSPQMPEPSEEVGWSCPGTTWQADPSPDQVECYEIVEQHKRCSCSGEDKKEKTYERVVPCPQWAPTRCSGNSSSCRHLLGTVVETEFADCEDDTGYAVADREFYREKCCEYPSVTLPKCEEHTESYKGGKSIEHGEDFWRGLYGDNTRFIPVSPEKGCGKHITRQLIEPEDCCDSIDPLTWDNVNSISVIQDNDEGFVYIKDGKAPFNWRIISTRGYVWFAGSGSGTLTTDERWAKLVSGDYPCGTYVIEVTDDCGTVVQSEVLSGFGQWVERTSPSGSSWWTMDELLDSGVSIPLSNIQSVALLEDPYGWGAEALMRIVTKVDDEQTRYEQYVGERRMYIVQGYEGSAITSQVYHCQDVGDDPPDSPAVFPFPTTIPTTVLPSGDLQEYSFTQWDMVPWPGDNDAGIWTNGEYTYQPDSRRTLYDLGVLGYLSAIGRDPMPNYHSVAGESELLWGYATSTGSDSGCCGDGQTCYQGYFSYLAYSQQIRIFDWDC